MKQPEQDFDTHPNWREALKLSPVQIYKESPMVAATRKKRGLPAKARKRG